MRRLSPAFVFEQAPFPACHAATVAEDAGTTVAAWFGGAREGAADVGIWLSRRRGEEPWSDPVQVASGRGLPCWNPVLHRPAAGGLRLYWRVGPSPRRWWSLTATSSDAGQSWSAAEPLPRGMLGPIKNRPLELADGTLLHGSSTEHLGWRCHIERSDRDGNGWRRVQVLNRPWRWVANQASVVDLADGTLLALCRTRQGVVTASRSGDGGASWSAMTATRLPNPNSGIDVIRLADGRLLAAANPVRRGRSPLYLLLSDDGHAWRCGALVEDAPGEYSYPSLAPAGDGRVHLVYTWNRTRIAHALVDPGALPP
ncbi:MAG: sialidase family protein [Geminicoccaceae bacterium]